jgi:hypothetical protein
MTFNPMRRPPIVSDVDRQWALDQEPADWAECNGGKAPKTGLRFTSDGELIDGDGLDGDVSAGDTNGGLPWSQHVDEQIEAFERYWASLGELKPAMEWSGLWRRVHWPKADPSIRHRKVKGVPHPFVRRGDDGWLLALRSLTPAEKAIAMRFGVVQFKPTDPRVAIISTPEAQQ